MRACIWAIITFIMLSFGSTSLYAQFSFIEEPYNKLEVSFLETKQEINPSVSFFNVLIIKNPTDRRLRFDLSFSLPAGWTLMGERSQSILLNPGESKMVPIRAAANINTQGDIGYSIVAALKDNNGRVFKNSYSIVNVPRKSDIQFRAMDRVIYFDPLLKKATVSFSYINNGNISELIYINFKLASTLDMLGASNQFFRSDFMLAPLRDTVISFDIILKKGYSLEENRNHRIVIETGGKDTSYRAVVWARDLDNKYSLDVPMSDRILVTELGLLNLFGQYDPVYEGSLWGSVHASENLNLEYFLRSVGSQFYETDPWLYSKMYTKVRYKRFRLAAGDITFPSILPLYGRGVSVGYYGRLFDLQSTYGQNVYNKTQNVGVVYNQLFTKDLRASLGFGMRENDPLFQEILPEIGLSLSLFKHITFAVKAGYSISEYPATNISHNGFGGTASVNVRYSKLTWNTRFNYGTAAFTGNMGGRTELNSNFNYKLTEKSSFQGNYTLISKRAGISMGFIPDEVLLNSQQQLKIFYNKISSSQLSYGIGPWMAYKGSNIFQAFDPNDWFSASTIMANFQVRYRNSTNTLNVSGDIRGGVNYTTSFSDTYDGVPIVNIDQKEKASPGMYMNLSARMKTWSISAAYYHGPTSISQHYSRFYNNYNSRSVRVIPTLNFLFLENLFEYNLRGTYVYDIGAQMNRLSVGNELVARPGYGWSLFFTNTIGYQATTDKQTEEKYKYSNMYFEFRIRKEFGFNQPRFKYLDLTVFFFKDLNGNGIRESEEPGVENVLVTIDKDYEMSDSLLGTDRRGEFYAMEFLSDLNGMVRYRNIVNGFYNIKFVPMGKTSGNFVTDNSNLRIHLDKSQTIDIPFQEKNKIFGQVMMNRSKLSNLGAIDISNIKVTATDSKGKMFSTLTDKNGKFVIYVPNVEKYTVSINNIFREHFELEQNSFEVQLNGYKQFELTYIFTEKQRRINFAQQLNFDSKSQQVQVVKRTNLGGTVKDGTTFAPIKALVKIVDELTGNIVSETVSDGRTGTFYISFVSGNNLRLDVTSDDYWFYSEKLVGDQLSTFMNLNRDLTLSSITMGSKLALRNVVFERNSADLNEEAKVELSRMLEVLKENPDIEIQIVGHCDDIEAIDNVQVAEDRAKAVMKHLMENGYSKVIYSSEGALQPTVDEATEEARKLNRRVEAIVVSK